ncbi:MAG: hypothetical protein HY554_17650, partial [Elusimicrobia bacterium]|nr:hypothetical protein [Elusimicrobiota bacterium]
MPCPNCGAAAAEGAEECASCGVVFEKWRRREALEKLRVSEPVAGGFPPPAQAPRAVSPAALAGALGLLAAAGAAALALLTGPGGRSASSAAQRLAGGAFALGAPEGWTLAAADCPPAGGP